MEGKIMKLTRIEGEYAYLLEPESREEIFIALALLPIGADVGTVLKYEDFEFKTVE